MLNHALTPSHAASSLLVFIYARTEGNPLFIEELVQSLQQSSCLEDTDEGMILAQEPESVPPTIHRLLAARLDRLPEASNNSPSLLLSLAWRVPKRSWHTSLNRRLPCQPM